MYIARIQQVNGVLRATVVFEATWKGLKVFEATAITRVTVTTRIGLSLV
jgi:hypothetical protein